MIEGGLYSYLTGLSTITAIVGSGSLARVYPSRVPQGATLPCIVYQKNGYDREAHLRGMSGVATSRFQLDCYAGGATGYSSAKSLADAVRLKMDGYRGAMGSETVLDCSLDSMIDLYDEPAHAEDHGTHRVSMDFSIVHRDTLPTYAPNY